MKISHLFYHTFGKKNAQTYPDRQDIFANLNEGLAPLSNLKEISKSNRICSASINREGDFKGDNQKWTKIDIFDFIQALDVNNQGTGNLVQATESTTQKFSAIKYYQPRYTFGTVGCYLTLPEVSKSAFLSAFEQLTGYILEESDFKYEELVSVNVSDFRKARVTLNNLFIHGSIDLVQSNPSVDFFEISPPSTIGFIPFDKSAKPTIDQIFLDAIKAQVPDDKKDLIVLEDTFFFDFDGSKLNTSTRSYYLMHGGIYNHTHGWGVTNFQYWAGVIKDCGYLTITGNISFDDIGAITQPGLYNVTRNGVEQMWLLVPSDMSAADAITTYMSDITFVPDDYKITNAPQDEYKALIVFNNKLIRSENVFVRSIQS